MGCSPFLGGLFADENLSTLNLNTLQLAPVPILSPWVRSALPCAKTLREDDPRMPDTANRVAISLSSLAELTGVKQIKGDGRAFLWKVAA
ncbi:MAG: hypothetical protein JWL86_3445 [Rhizobium sp.]|nr:hypothetical protein [Rhizobium sp.]